MSDDIGSSGEGFGANRRRQARRPAPQEGQPKPKPRQSAKNYGAWLLGRREWSEKELRTRFALKGYEQPDIETAIEFLKAYGLQSDERFAGSKVRMNATRAGNAKLKQQLKLAGVKPEVVEQALDATAPELERAGALMERKFAGRPADAETRMKAWRFLASRGFSGNAIEKAWREFKETAKTVVNDDEDLGPLDD